MALLVFNGAQDMYKADKAKKLLELSIQMRSPAAIRKIIGIKHDINMQDEECGRTPLLWSLWRHSRVASPLMLENGSSGSRCGIPKMMSRRQTNGANQRYTMQQAEATFIPRNF